MALARDIARLDGVRGAFYTVLGEQFADHFDPSYGIQETGGGVQFWQSITGRMTAQPTAASRPIWGATALNGFPGLTFDGTDDYLTGDNVSGLPVGDEAGEIWVTVDQQASSSDGDAARAAVGYGGTANGTFREIRRTSLSSVSRLRLSDGSTLVTDTNFTFNGRFVVRATFNGASSSIQAIGQAEVTGSLGAITGQARIRIGAVPPGASSLTGWHGVIGDVVIVRGVTEGLRRAALTALLQSRI